MTLPTQEGAYGDCYTIFNRAIDSPSGIRAPVGTKGQAQYLQLRMSQARAIRRQLSRRAFPPTHHAWDTSEYDSLVVRIRPSGVDSDPRWWIWVQHIDAPDVIDNIEILAPTDRPSLPGPNPYRTRQLQLSGPKFNDPQPNDLD